MSNNISTKEFELRFIKKCVIESRQDRLLFELKNAKKRTFGLCRFAHDPKSILKSTITITRTNSESVPIGYFTEIAHAMYICDNGGQTVSKERAMFLVSNFFGPLIIINSNNKAIIKTEDYSIYLLSF